MGLRKNRIKSIDFLRGIAVILVIFAHYRIIPIMEKIGWTGVDLFFVLSGFLVSGLLFREFNKYGNIRVGHFLIRRGFKIYPLFYTFLIFVIGLNIIVEKPFTLQQVFGEIFFLQNYIGKLLGHTWSLAVEEHFYFFIAFLFYFLYKRNSKNPFQHLALIFGAVAITCFGLRIYTFLSFEFIDQTHHYPSHLRIDSLFFGVVLSYLYNFKLERLKEFYNKFKRIIPLVIVIMLLPPFFLELESFFLNVFGLSFLYLGFGLLMLYCLFYVDFENQSGLVQGFINGVAYIGFYSYSVYLYHIPVRNLWIAILNKTIGPQSKWIEFGGYFIISIIVGTLASKIVEIPFLKIRDKYFPSRSKAIERKRGNALPDSSPLNVS